MTSPPLRGLVRAIWSAGDYDAVVGRIWSAGADVVRRAAVVADEDVLDVACGTGNAAIPAAQVGARVTGVDLTPELLDGARRRAERAGVTLELVEGDAEELPFADGSFDVVVSTFGCMFAPNHRRAAEEIARVLRTGGRIGIAAWTPEGSFGDFMKTLSALGPPPPPDFQPPTLWGTREHVEELFEGTGVDVGFEEGAVEFRFDSAEEAVDEYCARFGPVVMLRRLLEAQGRGEEVRVALSELFARWNEVEEGEGLGYPAAYLMTLGQKRA